MIPIFSGFSRSRNEILIPKYMCNTLVDAVLAANASPVFYSVDAHAAFSLSEPAILDKISSRTAAVVFVDYFGVPCSVSAAFLTSLRSRGIVVIRDASHAYLTLVFQWFKGIDNFDFTFTSIYKSLPTRVGALIFSREPLVNDMVSPLEFLRTWIRSLLIPIAIFLWNPLIRRQMTILRSVRNIIKYSQTRSQFIFAVLFRRFLGYIDEIKIIRQRRANAVELFEIVAASIEAPVCNLYSREQIQSSVVSAYPLLFVNKTLRDAVCEYMQSLGIDVRTWPIFSDLCIDEENWDQILLLPVSSPLGLHLKLAFEAVFLEDKNKNRENEHDHVVRRNCEYF